MGPVFFERLTNTCHNFLFKDGEIMSYLKDKRGITDNTIRSYKLGTFPKDLRDLANYIDWSELREHGIIWSANKSPFKHYPVIIPISGVNGVPIAIGGRSLYSEEKRKKLGIPKYYNSVYSKTSYLFGLDKAIDHIRDSGIVFVVEGYFDVLTAHQRGYKNVVATCGTIFSFKQLILLSRYAKKIILVFDNDAPGKISSDRVCKKFTHRDHDGVNIEYKFTPDGYKDLDEFLLQGNDLSLLKPERR